MPAIQIRIYRKQVIAHRLAGVLWKILHNGVRYIEQGDETNPRAKKQRAQKLAQPL